MLKYWRLLDYGGSDPPHAHYRPDDPAIRLYYQQLAYEKPRYWEAQVRRADTIEELVELVQSETAISFHGTNAETSAMLGRLNLEGPNMGWTDALLEPLVYMGFLGYCPCRPDLRLTTLVLRGYGGYIGGHCTGTGAKDLGISSFSAAVV